MPPLQGRGAACSADCRELHRAAAVTIHAALSDGEGCAIQQCTMGLDGGFFEVCCVNT